jgi:hypothetical protein
MPDPADRTIVTAVHHIMATGSSILKNRALVSLQIQHHHGVSDRSFDEPGFSHN